MREQIVRRVIYHEEVLRKAIKNQDFKTAYESQLLIQELQTILNQYKEEINLKEIVNEYYYSTKQVAKKLNKSHATIVRSVQNGKLKGVRVGRDYFFLKKYIDEMASKK
ncbi:helix-turn-helix domain-containing protein [Thermaerobacillus caldiproteolyticus]|uniref:Excisionase family DNA binding protein n=1 Tax=Thermaerobacillus caldiproteolyticus TaxID=247480 RepID=A0A7V9Z971_9BACL|nr:helix-turn-helix domain-containing protein [Anoxybacillus caldiproteolyticus]MBA2876284.1 excisionase family DNA binding protein [Anoxybacillus caldiproteolyticus]